jgi:hypothetical protein
MFEAYRRSAAFRSNFCRELFAGAGWVENDPEEWTWWRLRVFLASRVLFGPDRPGVRVLGEEVTHLVRQHLPHPLTPEQLAESKAEHSYDDIFGVAGSGDCTLIFKPDLFQEVCTQKLSRHTG